MSEKQEIDLAELQGKVDEIYFALLGRKGPFGSTDGFIKTSELKNAEIEKRVEFIAQQQAEMLSAKETNSVRSIIVIYEKWKVLIAFFLAISSFLGWVIWLVIEYYKTKG